MHRKFIGRGLVVAALVIVLLIGLAFVRGLVYERMARSAEVQAEIAHSSAAEQQITGPVLLVSWEYPDTKTHVDNATGLARTVEYRHQGRTVLLPERLQLNGALKSEVRQRGIYSANIFRTSLSIKGEFRIPENFGLSEKSPDLKVRDIVLATGITDVRGILGTPELDFAGQRISFLPGTRIDALAQGIHADILDLEANETRSIPFTISFELMGTNAIRFSPVGRSTDIELKADWPHPGFIGEFLPVTRTITDEGFTARWSTSSIATSLDEHFERCMKSEEECSALSSRHLGVSLVDPVNQYLLSERATKHGILFIGLTFIGFFLFEVMKSVAIHPVQYAFVGAGLLVFYLLLLSLSEHVGFALAYLVSAIACIGLIGSYVRSVLGSAGRAGLLAAGLGLLYACLYAVLNAEDYALLMGTAVLFIVLAITMRLTRNVNWFSLEQKDVAIEAQQ